MNNIHLGIILPASNITLESELYSLVHADNYLSNRIFLHFARAGFETRYKISGEKYLSEVVQDIPRELDKLKKITQLSNCAFFCTSGTDYLKKNIKVAEYIKEALGRDLVTPVESLIKAFKKLSIANPIVVTPYSPEISASIRHALEQHGIAPKKVVSLNLTTSSELKEFSFNKLKKLLIDELAKELYDGICVMCTNFPTFQIIHDVESELGVPVISSNQATLWNLLRESGVDRKISGYGRLFEE